LNIDKSESDFYTAGYVQGGIQYYSPKGKKWVHQLGLTSAISTNLRGERTTTYTEAGIMVREEVETDRSFDMPVSLGFGYAAVKNERLTIALDANYQYWGYQKVNYPNSYTNASFRFSSGIEYAFIKGKGNSSFENAYISAGVTAQNGYIKIRNDNLMDVSFSFGFGKNVSPLLSFYSGIEFGNRGNLKYNQVSERYTQFVLGITFKDVWLGPKFRKYD
jgi:hypothetical protein